MERRRQIVFSVNIFICGSFKNNGDLYKKKKEKIKKATLKWIGKEKKKTLQDPRCIKSSALRDSRLEHTFLVPF